MKRLLLALWLIAAGAAAAQETPALDEWRALADAAQARIETGLAEAELDALRAEIAAAREDLLARQGDRSSRIATVEGQLAALGAPPAEGETEPALIAAQRAALQGQLDDLLAPRRAAEAAVSEATGLIAEIDAELRARQAARLLARGPSPLDLALWPPALAEIGETVAALGREPAAAFATPLGRERAEAGAPIALAALIVGMVLILYGRRAARIAYGWASERLPPRGQNASVFVLSLGEVALPVLGVVAIAGAVRVLGVAGPVLGTLLDALPFAALNYLAARWVISWVFPRNDRWARLLDVPRGTRREGRTYAAVLGGIFALTLVLAALGAQAEWTAATRAVATFPLIVAIGAILLRVGQYLLRVTREPKEAENRTATVILRTVARAALLVGIVAPVLSALGYTAGATALAYPAVMTLALLALVGVLQQLVRDLYAFATGAEDTSDALAPVLIGFALTLAALPVLALIWGARVTDLMEVWARIRAGVRLGDVTISPAGVLTFALLFAIGYAITRLVQGALRTQVLPRTRIDPGGRTAITAGVGYVGIILAAVFAVTGAGIDLTSLAVVAGALSVGIGFGLQNVVNNFVSGIILLIERPISEGDWIDVNGMQGYVRDISVRSTRIETFDRTDVIIPNADLISGVVTNFTRGNLIGRLIVPVGVAYGSDTRHVERVLREVAEAHPMVTLNPRPSVLFRGFGDSALNFEVRAILRDVNWIMATETDLNHAIAARFAEEGIEIPFPQRDVWIRREKPAQAPREGGAAAEPPPFEEGEAAMDG